MKMTAELSLYPLQKDYKEVVLQFIEELLRERDIVAVTTSISTQLSGEHTVVFSAIEHALVASHDKFGRQVLVAKFIPEHFADIGPEV